MSFKKVYLVVLAILITVSLVVPAFAGEYETALEKERRYLNRYHDDLERYHDALKEKERLQQQHYVTPVPPAEELVPAPAPVPAPATVLVPRRYYYWDDYERRYYGIYINCDPRWIPPVDWGWILWTPYCGIPIYGWLGCGWRGGHIVINNFNVRHRGFDRHKFSRRFHERFGRDEIKHTRENFSGRYQDRIDGRREHLRDQRVAGRPGDLGKQHQERREMMNRSGEFKGQFRSPKPNNMIQRGMPSQFRGQPAPRLQTMPQRGFVRMQQHLVGSGRRYQQQQHPRGR